jgi:hypothetical protein
LYPSLFYRPLSTLRTFVLIFLLFLLYHFLKSGTFLMLRTTKILLLDHKNVVLPTYFLHVWDRSNPCGSKAQAVWHHKPT